MAHQSLTEAVASGAALQRLLVSVPETLYVLGIGRTTLYELVNSGDLVLVKIGRRTFLTTKSIDAYVERLTVEATR